MEGEYIMVFDIRKGTEKASNVFQKAATTGKKVAEGVQSGAKDIADKTKNEMYQQKMKKLNPLFLEKYNSEAFNLPNMIHIVDDAVRRDIPECKGAIGWLSKEDNIEVLHLYDEAVEMSGIQFVPMATCDAIYYVDNFDRNRFIRIDSIFSKANTERLAELEYIAYSLGAKSFSVEIEETIREVESKKSKVSLKEGLNIKSVKVSSTEKTETDFENRQTVKMKATGVIKLEGHNTPKRPELKWFKYDDSINGLIEMRCGNENIIKSKRLELAGAVSATMSLSTAKSIENAIGKIGVGGNYNIEKQALKENNSVLIYEIEF